MIRIDKNNVAIANQIAHYEKSAMRPTTYIKTDVYKKYARGGFWKALFHLDFSKVDVTLYYAGVVCYLCCIGERDNLEKWCESSKAHKIIDGVIYDMPYIVIYLSDGEHYIIYFESNEEMRKMEKKIIRKTRKR